MTFKKVHAEYLRVDEEEKTGKKILWHKKYIRSRDKRKNPCKSLEERQVTGQKYKNENKTTVLFYSN